MKFVITVCSVLTYVLCGIAVSWLWFVVEEPLSANDTKLIVILWPGALAVLVLHQACSAGCCHAAKVRLPIRR